MRREAQADFSADLSVSLPEALAALERELAHTNGVPAREDEPRRPAPGGVMAAEVRPLPEVLGQLLLHLRGLTRADAGSIFIRHGDTLRFTVVQNDFLTRQVGEEEMRRRMQGLPVPLQKSSLAGFVAVTGEVINVVDVYAVPAEREFRFNRAFDVRNGYRTHSVLAAPIVDDAGGILGVIELINALDDEGRPAPFSAHDEEALRSYAARAACVIATDRSDARRAALGTAIPAAPSEALRTPPPLAQHLGEVLVNTAMITPERLLEALAEQRRTGGKLGTILVRGGFVTDRELIDALSRQYGLEKITLSGNLDPGVVRLVPRDIARKHSIIPVTRKDGSLQVATADPTDLAALDAVAFITGLNVVPVLASIDEIHQALEQAHETASSAVELLSEAQLEVGDIEIADASEEPPAAQDTPVVRLVNGILQEAVRRGASDIHLESFAQSFSVRLRVDGVLSRLMTPSKRLEAAIVSRIKMMANLDPTEHRMPQDGRIKLRCENRPIDVRVSVVPTLSGESVNVRVLDGALLQPKLVQLGLESGPLAEFTRAIQQPHGIVLVTGPAGSGKTTTLYAAIHTLNKQDLKILTIEDPVEYAIEGVNQVHVQEDIGRTFGATLRAVLRHDPDVIVVGEIRDVDTAQSVVRAGLNGQLVLSTLHTDDCASTIARILEMGIPPFMLAATLKLLVAQRLVRKVCLECRRPYDFTEEGLVPYGHTPLGLGACNLYQSVGCRACNFTGMKGRVGLFEAMPVTPGIGDLMLRNGSIAEIRDAARQQGMKTLREAGLLQVIRGVTTLEEVLRVTSE
jgi:type IV pilus assembly protein PilB